MTLVITGRAAAAASSSGTSKTSASFTPAANAKLYAFAWAQNTGAAYSLSVSGGGLTWTLKASQTTSGGSFNGHVYLWEADTGASPAAMTVTITSTATVDLSYGIFDVAGSSPGIVAGQIVAHIYSGGSSPAVSGTLPAAAQSGHLTVCAIGANRDSSNAEATPSGFTSVIAASGGSDYEAIQIASSTSFTGTSTSWVNTPDDEDAGSVLFEIAEAGTGGGADTLHATLPAMTGHVTGTQTDAGTVAAQLPAMTGHVDDGTVPDPPFFTDLIGGTSEPVFIMSAEDWAILFNGGTADGSGDYNTSYDNYFTTRAAQGYNGVEVTMFSQTNEAGGHNGPDGDGLYPWGTSSLDPTQTPNATFWARRDYFLASALSHGFYVFLNAGTAMLDQGGFPASWTTAQWQAYGTFLGTRYPASSYPQIMWILGDDYFGDLDDNLTAFLDALRAAGGTQPMSYQAYQEASSRQDIYNGSTSLWGTTHADYNWGYSYNATYDVVEKMGLENDSMTPIPYMFGDGVFLNSGFTGITSDNYGRRMIWWALSSGSKSFNLGDNDVWQWDTGSQNTIETASFYNTQIPAIMAYWRALPDWHRLIADTSSHLVTGGRGTHIAAIASGGGGTAYTSDTNAYVTAARTPDGSLAVIYMSHHSAITIDESKMAAGYTATWVDPATGATSAATPGSTYDSTAKGTNSAGDADWVLVLAAPSGADAGTLAGQLPAVTGHVDGTQTDPGTVTGQLPGVTGHQTGTATDPGTVAGALPGVTGSLGGTQTDPGALAGSLDPVTGHVTGTQTDAGSLDADLPAMTGHVADSTVNTGTVDGTLDPVTGQIDGTQTDPGSLGAQLPGATGHAAGTQTDAGSIGATLPAMTGHVAEQTVRAEHAISPSVELDPVTGAVDLDPVGGAADFDAVTGSADLDAVGGLVDFDAVTGLVADFDAVTGAVTLDS